MNRTVVILLTLLAFVLGYSVAHQRGASGSRTCVTAETVTVRRVDTLRVATPVPVEVVRLRVDTVTAPTPDGDTVAVIVPVVQRVYSDSLFTAWVSGPIDPRLDSLALRLPVVTQTVIERPPPPRWALGITGGYGITPNGLQPFVGIGLTYTIASW